MSTDTTSSSSSKLWKNRSPLRLDHLDSVGQCIISTSVVIKLPMWNTEFCESEKYRWLLDVLHIPRAAEGQYEKYLSDIPMSYSDFEPEIETTPYSHFLTSPGRDDAHLHKRKSDPLIGSPPSSLSSLSMAIAPNSNTPLHEMSVCRRCSQAHPDLRLLGCSCLLHAVSYSFSCFPIMLFLPVCFLSAERLYTGILTAVWNSLGESTSSWRQIFE